MECGAGDRSIIVVGVGEAGGNYWGQAKQPAIEPVDSGEGGINMEQHHISGGKWGVKCIDIYLDREKGNVRIVDTVETSNRITISAEDWNELINRVKSGKIGKL